MMVTGISFDTFRNSVIAPLNASKYAENPIVIESHTELSPNRFRVKIGMTDSRGPGSRMSWSGRHGKWASYFTFWDIIAGIFHHNDSARVQAGNKVYRGAHDFECQAYEGLYDNVGSIMAPAYHEELSVNPEFDSQRFDWS